MFPVDCYSRWKFAGSIRRGKPVVGDIEHVIIPRVGKVETSIGLFSVRMTENIFFRHLDTLMVAKTLTKHLYTIYHADGTESITPKWGDRLRGVEFRGFNHEINIADEMNWGSILTIKTGPAEFSHRLVVLLRDNGWRNHLCYVRPIDADTIIPVATEDEFFKYAGLNWTPPEMR